MSRIQEHLFPVSEVDRATRERVFKIAVIGSILCAVMLFGAASFGFGNYFTFPAMHWNTIGTLHRFALIFLVALAVLVIVVGLGYQKMGKLKGDRLASFSLLPVAIASVVLISTSSLIIMAHSTYLEGGIGSYWNRCFFQNLTDNLRFTQLTLVSFAFLGIIQLFWGRTQLRNWRSSSRSSLYLAGGGFQVFSGMVFLLIAVPAFLFPPLLGLQILPSLPLLFCLTQISSAAVFYWS